MGTQRAHGTVVVTRGRHLGWWVDGRSAGEVAAELSMSPGAVRVAKSPDAMVNDVAAYLADPSLDAAGRRQVVLDQCQFTDGRSAERVVRLVLDQLGAAAARAATLRLAQGSPERSRGAA